MPRRFLFAHGAGAPSSSEWMRGWAELLSTLGQVETFDYPYMKAKRRAPDPLPRLIAAHREALERVRERHPGTVVLIGKSMGSRVGCHLALEEKVAAIVCLGYPLRGMGKAGKLRDEVLRALDTPVLFIQGTRDSLCPLDDLNDVRKAMQSENELHVVDSGNHSLIATKTHLKGTGQTQHDIDAGIVASIQRFVDKYA